MWPLTTLVTSNIQFSEFDRFSITFQVRKSFWKAIQSKCLLNSLTILAITETNFQVCLVGKFKHIFKYFK